MKIYTRTGDKGETSLIGGERVTKAHGRVEAYGSLDELCALLGALRMHVSPKAGVSAALQGIQRDLLALGAVLANPSLNAENCMGPAEPLKFPVEAMEADIDRLGELAPPPDSFVLPGATPGGIYAHFARTVCRRAERNVVALSMDASEPLWIIAHLNRLGDWLFALAVAEDGVSGCNI